MKAEGIAKDFFYNSLNFFLEKNGFSADKKIMMGKTEVDLFRLYNSVNERGGFAVVNENVKVWKEILDELQLQPIHNGPAVLRLKYLNYLCPVEFAMQSRPNNNPNPPTKSEFHPSTVPSSISISCIELNIGRPSQELKLSPKKAAKKVVNNSKRLCPRRLKTKRAQNIFLYNKALMNFEKMYRIDNNPKRGEFLDELLDHWLKRKIRVTTFLSSHNKTLDLYKLYELVMEQGGFKKVIDGKLWPGISKAMEIYSTSASNFLKINYKTYLAEFEVEKLVNGNMAKEENTIDRNSGNHALTKDFIDSNRTLAGKKRKIVKTSKVHITADEILVKAGPSSLKNTHLVNPSSNKDLSSTLPSECYISTEPGNVNTVSNNINHPSSETTLQNKSLRLWEYIQNQQAKDQNEIFKILLLISSTNTRNVEVVDEHFEKFRFEYDRFSKLVSSMAIDSLKAFHEAEGALNKKTNEVSNASSSIEMNKSKEPEELKDGCGERTNSNSCRRCIHEEANRVHGTSLQIQGRQDETLIPAATGSHFEDEGALNRNTNEESNTSSSIEMNRTKEPEELEVGYGIRINPNSCRRGNHEEANRVLVEAQVHRTSSQRNENAWYDIQRSQDKTGIHSAYENQRSVSHTGQILATSPAAGSADIHEVEGALNRKTNSWSSIEIDKSNEREKLKDGRAERINPNSCNRGIHDEANRVLVEARSLNPNSCPRRIQEGTNRVLVKAQAHRTSAQSKEDANNAIQRRQDEMQIHTAFENQPSVSLADKMLATSLAAGLTDIHEAEVALNRKTNSSISIEIDKSNKREELKDGHAERINPNSCSRSIHEDANRVLVEAQVHNPPPQINENVRNENLIERRPGETQIRSAYENQPIVTLTDQMPATPKASGSSVITGDKHKLLPKKITPNRTTPKSQGAIGGKTLQRLSQKYQGTSATTSQLNLLSTTTISQKPQNIEVNQDIANQPCKDDSGNSSVLDLSISKVNTRNDIEGNLEETQTIPTAEIELSGSQDQIPITSTTATTDQLNDSVEKALREIFGDDFIEISDDEGS